MNNIVLTPKDARQRLGRPIGLIPQDPVRILRAYPHELSVGMQQRVLCAVGCACSPKWMLADEPTKALDSNLRGQVQNTRLSLCRALLVRPEVLILDEPTSMLDISVQAQILQILHWLWNEGGLTFLLVTHDAQTVVFLCSRVQKLT